ncbi:MAG: hypothetical protein EOP84_00350 [Verrucomicrobiaceae bacterium]|nr:MAG: hypothetical protein EOP84_00350 [Verrucomicrobiaceae bacterium]
MSNERHLPFAEVASVRSWLTTFDREGKAHLHVDATFNIGRVGGEEGASVRFELGLKRADIVAIVGQEPLVVDPASVASDADHVQVEKKAQIDHQANATAELSGSIEGEASVNPSGSAKGSAAFRKNKEHSQRTSTSMSQTTGLIGSLQSQTSSGDYRWSLYPKAGTVLRGKPWNAAGEPRFGVAIRDNRWDLRIEPTIVVEVRCLYEDIDIKKVELLDVSLMDHLRRRTGQAARNAAAEAYIRQRVFGSGPRMSINPYASMVFAQVRCSVE